MKISSLLVTLAITAMAYGQENRFTLSGGYAFSDLEETDVDASGFRIMDCMNFSQSAPK